MMISRVMNMENWDIIESHVQVSPNIIKVKTRISTRQKEILPKFVDPTSREKKRMRAHPLILVQVWTMSVSTYV